MKKGLKIVFTIGIALTVIYLCLPYYVRQAVIHLYPDIDDLELFDKHVVHAPDSSRTWPKATDYNRYRMSAEEEAFLDEMETVAFLVIQHDSIVYENYRNGWNDTLTSNLFSGTKSIVGLLVGIAHEEQLPAGVQRRREVRCNNSQPAYHERRIELGRILRLAFLSHHARILRQ